MRTPGELRALIKSKTAPDSNGCWIWAGYVGWHGYGMVHIAGKNLRAHRVSHEAFVGPIPADLTIDHLCRNRACVNPAHLEPVTLVENVRRAGGLGVKNGEKTHCKHGHPFTPENTHLRKIRNSTVRECRACRKRMHSRLSGAPRAYVRGLESLLVDLCAWLSSADIVRAEEWRTRIEEALVRTPEEKPE